jgi:hypothetical protein
LRQLKLRLDSAVGSRAAEWFDQVGKPLQLHDIIGG